MYVIRDFKDLDIFCKEAYAIIDSMSLRAEYLEGLLLDVKDIYEFSRILDEITSLRHNIYLLKNTVNLSQLVFKPYRFVN